ncbi:MAG TPA: hypothetical protein VHB54_14075 [Mucilaginibacter sp.]|nr:hypothetical protein [Mucilaginibacter sp.]HVW14958.1 hypothetical protein [Mucilaginibacter sp.]
MEVHHHPEVEKKGFKEYLLEGLMIFIAVMMGFIAESVRENISDREHVKQLVLQLVQDLKTDTISLDLLNKSEQLQMAKNDTLIQVLKEPITQVNKEEMQNLILFCYDVNAFHPANGAITAIKNEIYLKSLSDSKLISYIANYEADETFYQSIYATQYENLRGYLQPFLSQHFTSENLDKGTFNRKLLNGDMRDLKQNDMIQLASDVAIIKVVNHYLSHYNRDVKKKADVLIQYTRKQFHLE